MIDDPGEKRLERSSGQVGDSWTQPAIYNPHKPLQDFNSRKAKASKYKTLNRLGMTSDQFCLKWNNYQANIVVALGNLKLDEDFVDVTLACDGKTIKAHRVVLSACSSYFKHIFKVGFFLSSGRVNKFASDISKLAARREREMRIAVP